MGWMLALQNYFFIDGLILNFFIMLKSKLKVSFCQFSMGTSCPAFNSKLSKETLLGQSVRSSLLTESLLDSPKAHM